VAARRIPHEAGLLPGVKAMEDRDRDLLLREVLADLLVEAERSNDAATLLALEKLSVRMGPEAVPGWLLRCAKAREAWEGPSGWQPPMRSGVLRLLGLPSDASAQDLADLCSDEVFDTDALECCLAAYRQWSAATGQKVSAQIAEWLEAGPAERLTLLDDLHKQLFTLEDGVKNIRYVAKWDEAKLRAGFIDFDDQIRRAAALLTRSDLSEWIRYKLDRRFDHVLVDEAQDTNAAQWQIIFALTGDFFAGEGAHGDKLRTLFVVGDYKQAIFRFQGTSPENFEAARQRVKLAMSGLAENVRALGKGGRERSLRELGLGTSFRTAQSILQFVDMAIGRIGPASFGLDDLPVVHNGEERPGLVTLWRVVGDQQDGEDEGDEGEESWLSRSTASWPTVCAAGAALDGPTPAIRW
jgi:ATP-dependent helicase/nuclease subunit A